MDGGQFEAAAGRIHDAGAPHTAHRLNEMARLKRIITGGRPEFMSPEALILQYGAVFSTKPCPEELVGEGMGLCYRNAFLATMMDSDRFAFVEGIAHKFAPVPHAWVLDLEDGLAFDPTWTADDMDLEYVGIPFSWHYAMGAMQKRGSMLGGDGFDYDTRDPSPVLRTKPKTWLHQAFSVVRSGGITRKAAMRVAA